MVNQEKEIIKEAKIKAARYCAYRERAPLEIRQKLGTLGLNEIQIEQILHELTKDGFVNEQRFATAFAGGKFRLKKWGKLKISHSLKNLEITESNIRKAIDSLAADEYLKVLRDHIKKKRQSLRISDPFVINHKIAQFVISKGFEPELVWKELKTT
jgi:regulatory protein